MNARVPSGLGRIGLVAGLGFTLVLLLLHAGHYAFLCDDAFISFRYAAHLAEGHGPVFNPGLERVEGYTNFLWVLILSGFASDGLRPESMAMPLSLAATIGLWAVVAWFAWRGRDAHARPDWIVLVPPLLLATTRSVAVWSTSGLETRLFEWLTVLAVLRLCVEIERGLCGREARNWISASLFGLATLTRPDAALVFGAATAVGFAWLAANRALRWRRVLIHASVYAAIVGAHALWRRAFYGAWLPNTFHAKVGGRSWSDAGWDYVGAFALEYAMWLWIPALVAGVWWNAKRGSGFIPAIFAAVVLPHALYVVSIGGDHFEYRPLDLYFPFAFLLVGDGLRATIDRLGRRGHALAFAGTVVLVWAVAWLPWRAHLGIPDRYLAGFPGLQPDLATAERFLDPGRDPFYRWPGLRALGEIHRDLVWRTTERFVGIRQETHRAFLDTAAAEGRELAGLVERGQLPEDAYIATDCAGAIPYYSGLPTLDRLGLNDARVARSEPGRSGLLAHEKRATLDYARERGVELWAADRVHLVLTLTAPDVRRILDDSIRFREEIHFADIGSGRILLAKLPIGEEAVRDRYPALAFRSTRDVRVVADLRQRIVAAESERLAVLADSRTRRFAAAELLVFQGHLEQALEIYRSLPDDGEARYRAGVILVALGRRDAAIDSLREAVFLRPRFGSAWIELGSTLLATGRVEDAVDALRRGIERMPGDLDARLELGWACHVVGNPDCAQRQLDVLRGDSAPRARFLAMRLQQAMKRTETTESE